MNAAVQTTRQTNAFKPLKVKRQAKRSFYRLPFTNHNGSFGDYAWSLPATGGYFGGYKAGRAMAIALLKHLRNYAKESDFSDQCLTNIMQCLTHRFHEAGGIEKERGKPMSEWDDEFNSIRGQYAGFTNTLSKWISVWARQWGSDLDEITDKALVQIANAGLQGTDEDLYAACGRVNKRGGAK